MRLVDLVSFYSPAGGGIATYLHAKTRELVRRGWEVHRIVPHRSPGVQRTNDGAWEHRLGGVRWPLDRNYHLYTDVAALRRRLVELAPDTIECSAHMWMPHLLGPPQPQRRGAGRVSARWLGYFHADVPRTYIAPAVARVSEQGASWLTDAAWSWLRRGHAAYDATLCASAHAQRVLVERGVSATVRVGLGVDPQRFAVREQFADGPVLYVGRLSPEKNVTALAGVARMLLQRGRQLEVVGDGPLRGWLAAQSGCNVVGSQPPSRVAALMQRASVVVVPGRFETFGLTGLEALACGTPIVTANEGAVRELVDTTGAGVVAQGSDATAIADAVEEVLSWSAAKRRERGIAAAAWVRANGTWSRVVDRLERAYRGESPEEMPCWS